MENAILAPRSVTLKELAEHLDVSITTVSRALADSPTIALKTRKRVAEAARALGYVPNTAARQLVSGRSGFVGFVLPVRSPNFIDSYFGEFITGLGQGLVRHGIDLFIATVQEGQSELDVLRHVVESGRADGVVLPRISEDDARVHYLIDRQVPFVTHGRLLGDSLAYNWLDSDHIAAFGEAFDLLYELGHRRFGLVSIAENMTFRRLRERGFREAIARRGDPEVQLDIINVPRFDRERTKAGIAGLLSRPSRPTAVVGLFDELALMVLEEAARLGLSIPGDLSLIGFDNVMASAYAPPGLTTFDANPRSAAEQIAEMLVGAIEREEMGQHRLVRPRAVLRGSHGPVPQTF